MTTDRGPYDRVFCAADCGFRSCHRHSTELSDDQSTSTLRWADFSINCAGYFNAKDVQKADEAKQEAERQAA